MAFFRALTSASGGGESPNIATVQKSAVATNGVITINVPELSVIRSVFYRMDNNAAVGVKYYDIDNNLQTYNNTNYGGVETITDNSFTFRWAGAYNFTFYITGIV